MSTPFLGGALKLKGDSGAIGKAKKKKKKAPKPEAAGEGAEQAERQQQQRQREDAPAAAAAAAQGDDEQAEAAAAAAAQASAPPIDRRTEAERRRDAQLARVEEERLRKRADKGYRERVAEYNDKLAQLSEHHDIPRVGPG